MSSSASTNSKARRTCTSAMWHSYASFVLRCAALRAASLKAGVWVGGGWCDQSDAVLEKEIHKDLDRTYPDHILFRDPTRTGFTPGRISLLNVLKAYALFDKQVCGRQTDRLTATSDQRPATSSSSSSSSLAHHPLTCCAVPVLCCCGGV
jgi:hypothetical protein